MNQTANSPVHCIPPPEMKSRLRCRESNVKLMAWAALARRELRGIIIRSRVSKYTAGWEAVSIGVLNSKFWLLICGLWLRPYGHPADAPDERFHVAGIVE